MRALFIILLVISSVYSEQYVFLLNKNDTEKDYEAKIISKIASSSLDDKIKVYIPNISKEEKRIFLKYFDVTQNCQMANFIFDNKGIIPLECKNLKKLFFTNNYRRLLSDRKYYGAFFWNKSRPNIVFIKQRLEENNVKLPREYARYIEDFYDE